MSGMCLQSQLDRQSHEAQFCTRAPVVFFLLNSVEAGSLLIPKQLGKSKLHDIFHGVQLCFLFHSSLSICVCHSISVKVTLPKPIPSRCAKLPLHRARSHLYLYAFYTLQMYICMKLCLLSPGFLNCRLLCSFFL